MFTLIYFYNSYPISARLHNAPENNQAARELFLESSITSSYVVFYASACSGLLE